MKITLRILIHTIIALLLTAITQIGGLVYLVSVLLFAKSKQLRRLKQASTFVLLYSLSTWLIVPPIAKQFGRVPIKNSLSLKPTNAIYVWLNRNYVKPKLRQVLTETSVKLHAKYPGIRLQYLDACFPFGEGFPLLPHLSHNDGKKVDLSFIYMQADGTLTNKKTSRTGYGVFVAPLKNETDYTQYCKNQGSWHYDFPKYITLGKTNKKLQLANKPTAYIVNELCKQTATHKIYIEPNLKKRLKISSSKVRFHGCVAVRHDDHIHLQIK